MRRNKSTAFFYINKIVATWRTIEHDNNVSKHVRCNKVLHKAITLWVKKIKRDDSHAYLLETL